MMIDELANDDYLPCQTPSARADQPARKLWLAVLRQGIQDLKGHGALGSGQHHGRLSGPRAAVTASKWFSSGSQDVASFLWLCTSLSLDPDEIRRALPKVPERCHDVIRTAPLRYRLEWGV